uniref:G-patch domain-containing protein n=1 Tax=Angiostrongylus cantonensis TaxID=6313 RepID=A0A0K0D0Y3_ANGCA
MSSEELAVYGTEFEELEDEEKSAISRKPAGIQDQIVTDEQGRRRFHGAFTGGFSAGYYNTVGSKEGWTPQEFRSSRDQRAAKFQQRAEDLMDDEDLGEFGIGARRIRTAEDFTMERKAEKRMAWEHDVTSASNMVQHLETIIKPVRDSIGKRMLRAMGWREGRGVGLLTAKSKGKIDDVDAEQIKTTAPNGYDTATDDVLMTRLRSVEGVHGLGYEAMAVSSVLDEGYGLRASAFKTNTKSRGIRGQAFGVGAFEDEDENIYSNYDLNQFDFALDAPGTSGEGRPGVDCTFVVSNKRLNPRKFYAPPKLPPNFRPTHRPKPLDSAKLPSALQDAMKTLTAIQRAKLLGENRVSVMEIVIDKDRKRLEQHRSRWDQREKDDRVEFPDEPMKQTRFKDFLKYLRRGLVFPQPKELSVWEWESEKKEFEAKLTADERGMLPEVSF